MISPQTNDGTVYCVPALVDVALNSLVGASEGIEEIARGLGVRVRYEAEDVWNLGVAPSPGLAGVTRDDAVTRIPLWLRKQGHHLDFHYAPLFEIQDRDAESFCERFLRAGSVVGASLNWQKLTGHPGESLHVLQVVNYTPGAVQVFDPTGSENQQHHTLDPQKFESSILDINGGFWVFERKSS